MIKSLSDVDHSNILSRRLVSPWICGISFGRCCPWHHLRHFYFYLRRCFRSTYSHVWYKQIRTMVSRLPGRGSMNEYIYTYIYVFFFLPLAQQQQSANKKRAANKRAPNKTAPNKHSEKRAATEQSGAHPNNTHTQKTKAGQKRAQRNR